MNYVLNGIHRVNLDNLKIFEISNRLAFRKIELLIMLSLFYQPPSE